jgi:hypothetical protein
MYVKVDHARGYNAALAINNMSPIGFWHVETQYFILAEDQVSDPVNAISRVNYSATA